MKLQLSLDLVTIEEATQLIEATRDFIDIIEIGTPLIIKEGVSAIRTIHSLFPEIPILADLKIMDGGKPEATLAFEAGADIVTVLAAAEDQTLINAVEVAKHMGKKIMVDMIAIRDIETRAMAVDGFGVDYICVHTAVDIQHTGKSPLEDLLRLKAVIQHARTAIAGGIKLDTAEATLQAEPEILIVGGAITSAYDQKEAARTFKQLMQQTGR